MALGSLAVAPSVFAAAPAAEVGLAARYAPVVKLVAAPAECGPGDPYVPIDVNLLFDDPTVALRGPWGGADLVKVAPSAADLAHGLYEYHLDFPGNALSPGCGYIEWSRRITTGHAPTVYAHVATDPDHPGEIALQYWMFYVFNDWNNLHEGDWEMIQLNFHAGTPAQALATAPYEVGYSQHEGAEGSSWTDPKLEKVDGTHPVVYPAAGSHANFYSSELYLGASGSQGVGCDDTRNAELTLKPTVAAIPSAPAAALADFPWIGFEGRWGELQPAFFNGPTGPNLKTSWTHPITWSQDWRDRAYAVPAGGVLGTATTDFFCGAMRHGSRLLWRVVSHPVPTVVGVLLALVLVLYLLSRARWRPAAPLRLARRRSWGQILAAATRMYISRFRLFLGIGLLVLPISVVITLIQAVVLHASSVLGVENEGGAAGFLVMLGVAIGTAFTLLGLGLVQAATARALIEIDSDRPTGPVQAYGMVVGTVRPLLGALVVGVVAVSILLSSVFLLPVAIWLAVRWSLLVPAVELENRRALGALGRSNQLVSRGWLKVGSLTVAAAAVVLAAGPLIGTLLIVFTSLPLSLLNLIAGLVYVVAMPFVALTTMYVYFDARVRDELSPKAQAGKLPPEIDLSAARPS